MPESSRAVEINREYYGELLPGRDDYWRKMAAPRLRVRTILGLLRELRPQSLIDLGCGNGKLLSEVAAALPRTRLAGIDLSQAQIEENRSARPDIDWHCHDLEQPLPQASRLCAAFEVAVGAELIEHLDHPQRLLELVRELVPAGGHLVLSTQSGRVHQTERLVGHRRHWSAGELSELLSANGWTPLRVWNCGYPFHDWSKWYANRDPEASLERYSARPYGWFEEAVCLALRTAFLLNSRRRGAQLFALAQRSG